MRVLWRDFIKGIWDENPTFRMLIGMCPVLAVTTAVENGFIMGLAVLGVLTCSSTIISLLRKVIPNQVRIPVFIVIIATFVTIADMVLAAAVPSVHKVLGLFVPLIVVNCIILGRAEAFASKNPVPRAIADALGMSMGIIWALTFVSSIREILGRGTFLGIHLFGESFVPVQIMIMPPGAFLTLGTIVGCINVINYYSAKRRGKVARATAKDGGCHAPAAD